MIKCDNKLLYIIKNSTISFLRKPHVYMNSRFEGDYNFPAKD